MASVTELQAEQDRIKAELKAARKAENAAANARKRAGKQLDRWQTKNFGILNAHESGIVTDLVEGLSK